MSNCETENIEKDESSLSKTAKLCIKNMFEVKNMTNEDIYQYINDLHGLLKKQNKKLKKYRNKINKLVKEFKNCGVLKNEEIFSSEAHSENSALNTKFKENQLEDPKQVDETKENNGITAQDAFNFVDEMRQAAQHAQSVSNFIYEPTSGLYYDQKSGYYYNAGYGLYYDGNTGCYYNYNQKNNCYEFHSQVQVQPTSSMAKDDETFLDTDEIVFDEFGVVTDQERIKNLCQKKKQQRDEVEHKYKKKSNNKSKNGECKERKTSHKRCKNSSKHNDSNKSDSGSKSADLTEHNYRLDFEDGELSSSSTDSSTKSELENEKRKVPIYKNSGCFQDIAKKYPPSLRIIVQETNLEDLKVGSLSLITFKGGSLGREGSHEVVIPDVNVSKFHLKFIFDTEKAIYKCLDLGSRNGTVLNGVRMSPSKTESDLYDLVHGSVIQIGQTKLLCHMHEGNSTCGLCEPGLLIDSQLREVSSGFAAILSHKEQLKKIQKKYGLENEKFIDSNNVNDSGAGCSSKYTYQDRAATRRLKVGSSTDKEKTQTASVNTAISSDNKGFRMLSKLGWNIGEGLGKIQGIGGLLEPISINSNAGYKGLGCNDTTAGLALTSSDKKKIELMKKIKARYQAAGSFSINSDNN